MHFSVLPRLARASATGVFSLLHQRFRPVQLKMYRVAEGLFLDPFVLDAVALFLAPASEGLFALHIELAASAIVLRPVDLVIAAGKFLCTAPRDVSVVPYLDSDSETSQSGLTAMDFLSNPFLVAF